MQRQLCFVVDKDLQRLYTSQNDHCNQQEEAYVLHKLTTHRTDLLAQRRTEHHDLFVVWRLLEDILDITAHVERLEHLVALVEDKVLALLQIDRLFAEKREEAAWSGDNNVRRLRLQDVQIPLDANAAIEDIDLDRRHVLCEARELVSDLKGKLARVAKDDDDGLAGHGLDLLEGGEDEDGRLAHATLCLAEDVHAENGLRNALLLDYTHHRTAYEYLPTDAQSRSQR